ncbi:SDR family oxidoreductase [Tunicatimonas pelagia]|uniref:SDR family oxidoreductase n=1 Tax=Tunicatimonas pelagia TaxID=931531 RepID=UPI00266600F3|nr:SDR family oxidoreductase [Tunicatimonas pelagia]WKN41962.1 SDR family oxidoreductase [Tunicatimonas pelagia]
MADSLSILVVGATGRTGAEIVSKLHNAGHTVHALVRNTAKAQRLLASDIHLIEHDLQDYSGYDTIVQGKDIIVYAAGSTSFRSYYFGKNTPKHIDYQSVRQMAMAAENHSVKQFILISSMGVTHPFFFLNIFGRVLTWKLRGENALRSTHLNYVIIRPGKLIDEGYTPEQCVLYQDDKIRNQAISREEVAEITKQCVANPDLVRVTFELIKDESLAAEPLSAKFARLIPDQNRTPYTQVKVTA